MMANLRNAQADRAWLLPASSLIGRSRTCVVRLPELEVSGEHAMLRWKDGIWELQDLHSRNGTFVDGRLLEPGDRVGLREGATLGFGRPEGYVLADAGPPQAHAIDLSGERPAVEARTGLLALPDGEQPELSVYHRDQRWWLERGADLREVEDGEQVEAGGASWRLSLPERLPQTIEHSAAQLRLSSLLLRFGVSEDERHVDLVAAQGERTLDLKARAHHHPLLLLARARLQDRELAPAQQGWVLQDDLLAQLAIDSNRLYVDIYRVRRQLAEAGVVDAEHVIERRLGTRQLRIGTSAVEIVRVERKRSLR